MSLGRHLLQESITRWDAPWTGWPQQNHLLGETLFSILTQPFSDLLWACKSPEDKAFVFWLLNFGCSGPLCCDLLSFAVLSWCWLCFAGALSLFWLRLSLCVGRAHLCLRLSLAVTHGDYPGSLSAPACHSTQTTCRTSQQLGSPPSKPVHAHKQK